MNILKFVFTAAFAIILVVSVLTALFGAGRVVNAVLEAYVFKVENCRYDSPRPVFEKDPDSTVPDYEEKCEVDYNQAKRDIANGTGMFIVFAPLAWFMYGQTRKMIDDTKVDVS